LLLVVVAAGMAEVAVRVVGDEAGVESAVLGDSVMVVVAVVGDDNGKRLETDASLSLVENDSSSDACAVVDEP
jgi:hypothetical protein